ncbi:MAG: flagellar motor switch protein FliM [Pseudomonadota bacterium]
MTDINPSPDQDNSDEQSDDFSFAADPSVMDQPAAKKTDNSAANKKNVYGILSSSVSHERLPMLEFVFERFMRIFSTSLRTLTSENIDISMVSVESQKFGDYVDGIPEKALINVFKVEEWDNNGLMVFSNNFVQALIEVLMGGRSSLTVDEAPRDQENRKYTTIERALMRKIFENSLNDLAEAFEPLSAVAMTFLRIEENARFANIARPTNAAVFGTFEVLLDGHEGSIEIVFPYATLEPIRELLLQIFMGEKFGRDSIWERHLVGELWKTRVHIKAVLAELECDLGDVLNWKEGTLLPLGISRNDPITVKCGPTAVLVADIGKKGTHVALKIREMLLEKHF